MKHTNQNLGLNVEFDGSLTVLNEVAGAPIVFLVDEYHKHACVLENIAIGDILIPGQVSVIGVESHWAYQGISEESRANEDPRFANHFYAQKRCVVGVECEQLFEIQMKEFENRIWPDDLKSNPCNYLRSHFFLIPLFRAWRELGQKVNLLLNAGRRHNDDIQKMVERGEADEIAGVKAYYVRIRAASYPTT